MVGGCEVVLLGCAGSVFVCIDRPHSTGREYFGDADAPAVSTEDEFLSFT